MRSIYLGLLATCVASITPVSAVAADSEIRVSDAITAAVAWANGPDEANALLIQATRPAADRIIPWD